MKQVTCILIVLLFSFFKSEGQITKGNWLLGGSASFSKTTYNSNGEENKISLLGFSPNIGTFLLDKFATGIKASYVHEKISSDDASVVQNSYRIGPFLRYYFLSEDKPFNLLLEGSYQYATTKTNAFTLQQNIYSFNGGPVLFLNNVVGLEFLFGYSNNKTIGVKQTIKQWGLSVGLQIHLEQN